MMGNGRENSKDNDLFYLCSLIDYIARKTKNVRSDIVNKLGKERLEKIYDLADVYHSFISAKIDDYNSSVYYENPSYLFESYRDGKVL